MTVTTETTNMKNDYLQKFADLTKRIEKLEKDLKPSLRLPDDVSEDEYNHAITVDELISKLQSLSEEDRAKKAFVYNWSTLAKDYRYIDTIRVEEQYDFVSIY